MNTYSIIIPHRNNIDGLIKLLESIFRPKVKEKVYEEFKNHLDVIVIDDHSDEDVLSKIKELIGTYNIKLFYNSGKRSAGACRNIGLEKAIGDYLLFSDSDDYFSDDYYKTLLLLENNDADIIYFSPKSVLYTDNSVESDRHVNHENLVNEFLNGKDKDGNRLKYYWYGPWSKRIKSDYIHKLGIKFDETIASNDAMFSMLAAVNAKKIYAVKNVIYYITTRKGSLIYSVNYEAIKDKIWVGVRLKEFYDKIGYKDYKDNCFIYLAKGLALRPRQFLRLLRYSIKIGVFGDFKYAIKSIWKVFFRFIRFLLFKKFKISYMEIEKKGCND